MVKVSVIMSVYNENNFIRNSVASILNQTFEDFELIIIDDCSSDGTFDYLKSIQDQRLILLRNAERQGLTKNLNKAARLSRGEYIARMDADDISLPSRLEKQVSFMAHHSYVKVCGCSFNIIDENDIAQSEVIMPTDNKSIKASLIMDRWSFAHPSVMMRKKNVEYDESYLYSQDLKLWFDLYHDSAFYNMSEVLLYYRQHAKQISTDKKKEQDYYAVLAFSSFFKTLFEDKSEKFLSYHMKLLGREPIQKWPDLFHLIYWFFYFNLFFQDKNDVNTELLFRSSLHMLKQQTRNFVSFKKVSSLP